MLTPSGRDDTSQIQTAIDCGGVVWLGPGIFQIQSTLKVTDRIKIVGCGKLTTFLRPIAGIATIEINVPTEGYSTILEDFGVLYPTQSDSSAQGAICVRAGTGHEHTGFEARNLYIEGASIGIKFYNASYWRITGTKIVNSTHTPVLVRNTNHADSGDGVISDCSFINPSITSGSAVGILLLSGGGLRVVGSKLNVFNQAVQVSLARNVLTCNLIMTGCSCESVGFTSPNAPILLQNPTGTGRFSNVIVTGNQFNGWNYGYANVGGLINVINQASGWCSQIAVASNVIS